MKRICIGCTCIFGALVFSLLSTNASAHVSEPGLDFRASLDVPIEILVAGIGLNLNFGYRWAYAGIYVSQDLDFIFSNDPFSKDDYWGYEATHDVWFQGATYLTGLGFIPISDNWEMFLGMGIGVMYYSNDLIPDPDVDDDTVSNPFDLSLKFMFGMTYYINERFGIGFNLNYSLTIDWYHDEYDGTDSVYLNHTIYPGIQMNVKF